MKKAMSAIAEIALEEEASPPARSRRRERKRSIQRLEDGRSAVERALTPRETEILRCLSEGMTTRAVAAQLVIAPVTVRNHVQRILQKLGAHSKLAAVVCAYRKKLI